MFEFAGAFEPAFNWIFLGVTGYIAIHAIQSRTKEEGGGDYVRLLFGCIAAVFFFLVLIQDILEIARF